MGISHPTLIISCDDPDCTESTDWHWSPLVRVVQSTWTYTPATREWVAQEMYEITSCEGWVLRDGEVFCEACATKKGLNRE
jgi:hypothetical protein